MIQINMEMPKNCCGCWIRLAMGCQIANASGWLNNRRDKMCPLIEVPNNGGWISVQDRLPDNGQDVLAYLNDGEETRVAPCNYANGVWFDCVMNCVVTLHHITHWMPLPEPPKEET